MGVASYRDLLVWQKAMDLTVACYKATEQFPRTEVYGLARQLQRAAASVPANIAEGAGREFTREYIYHVSVANGSLFEVETHLLLAERLGYVSMSDIEPLLATSAEVGRMIRGLINALERKLS